MDDLYSVIRSYFQQVETHIEAVDKIIKESKKPCSVISNHSIVYLAVVPADALDGTLFSNIPDYQTLLVTAIKETLDREVVTLKSLRENLAQKNEELFRKQRHLQENFDQLRKEGLLDASLVIGGYPRLQYVEEWSMDVWRYYHGIYLQASQALRTLDLVDSESISRVIHMFDEDQNLKIHINYIRSFNLHTLTP